LEKVPICFSFVLDGFHLEHNSLDYILNPAALHKQKDLLCGHRSLILSLSTLKTVSASGQLHDSH